MKKAHIIILLVASLLVSATGFYLGFTEIHSALLKFVELFIAIFMALTSCVLLNIIDEKN